MREQMIQKIDTWLDNYLSYCLELTEYIVKNCDKCENNANTNYEYGCFDYNAYKDRVTPGMEDYDTIHKCSNCSILTKNVINDAIEKSREHIGNDTITYVLYIDMNFVPLYLSNIGSPVSISFNFNKNIFTITHKNDQLTFDTFDELSNYITTHYVGYKCPFPRCE